MTTSPCDEGGLDLQPQPELVEVKRRKAIRPTVKLYDASCPRCLHVWARPYRVYRCPKCGFLGVTQLPGAPAGASHKQRTQHENEPVQYGRRP